MRKVLTIILLLSWAGSHAQFHVRVTCNPRNQGEVNPEWLNNYVVEWTADDWSHYFIVNYQATYQGYRDDGTAFMISAFEANTFPSIDRAITYARQFVSLKAVGKYEAEQYQQHLALSRRFEAENKAHPINSKPPSKDHQCQERIIY